MSDTTAARVRRCRACGGEMVCKARVEYRVNGSYSGRDYTFVCQKCGAQVTEKSPGSIAFNGMLVVGGGGLGGMMSYFGVKMLVDTIQHGANGNSLAAVIIVLVLFLGLGVPFFLVMLWLGKTLVAGWLELRKNPVIR